MKTCHICRNSWPDDTEICPQDHVPLNLSRNAARLYFDPENYYKGSGGIDSMESALGNFEEILAQYPNHTAAAKIKEEIERVLPDFIARADDLSRLLEARFAADDLAGCLEILSVRPVILREEHGADLRRRVRQRIAEGAKAGTGEAERNRRLAETLFNELDRYYFEGIGGVGWMEVLLEGLAEVLFLSPEHREAAGMKNHIARSFAKACEESEKLFRAGEAFLHAGDLRSVVELLWCNEIQRLRWNQASQLRRRAKHELLERIEADGGNEEWKTLLHRLTSRWVDEA
jgi:hypothetical protein